MDGWQYLGAQDSYNAYLQFRRLVVHLLRQAESRRVCKLLACPLIDLQLSLGDGVSSTTKSVCSLAHCRYRPLHRPNDPACLSGHSGGRWPLTCELALHIVRRASIRTLVLTGIVVRVLPVHAGTGRQIRGVLTAPRTPCRRRSMVQRCTMIMPTDVRGRADQGPSNAANHTPLKSARS